MSIEDLIIFDFVKFLSFNIINESLYVQDKQYSREEYFQQHNY